MLPLPLLMAAAPAAQAHGHDSSASIFLAEILLLLLVGRLLGEVMHRLRQPAVMGQLLAGILLGPSVLGAFWPEAQHALFPADPEQKKMIDAVSQLGVLMLLLLTGMETDLKLVKRVGRTAAIASVGGVALPFLCGFVLGEFLPDSMLPDAARRLPTSLFLATALSISSIKIVAAVLREVDFLRRDLGQIILAAAILDDTLGWIIIALIGGIAAHGSVHLSPVLVSVVGVGAFLGVSFTIGRRWVAWLIRWTNDHFLIEMPVITAILALMLALALLTNLIGVHTVLGAFVAGVLVGQSPILTRHIEEQLRGLIVALFMPVFFGVAGLSIDLTVLRNPQLLGLALGLIAIASFGKLAGCYTGGRLARMGPRESTALAIGMNARGSTEIIVATIGLAMGVLNRNLFTLIVLMAIFTTLFTPPLLRWALARTTMSEDEKKRLERESADKNGFVPKLERLLVATDGSANGNLAARLAGWLIGARQLTATILDLSGSGASVAVCSTAAQETEHEEQEEPASVESLVTAMPVERQSDDGTAKTVLTEAKNGYDMLFLGVDHVLKTPAAENDAKEPRVMFHASVEAIVRECSRPVAIALARHEGKFLEREHGELLNILVPTTGADYSLAGAEVAVAIAKGCGTRITALHVARPPLQNDPSQRAGELLQAGRAVLADLEALGRREGVEIGSRVLVRPDQEAAILRQIERGRHNLVVLGAKLRPGEQLAFGQGVSVLLEHIPCSVLVIAF